MAVIGQNIPYISKTPNAAQWNNAANILNALRNINIGSGLNSRFTANGLSIASTNIDTNDNLSFPWGKEWICGLDTTVLSTSSIAIQVYNYYPKNPVNNAELLPSTYSVITPLSTAPLFAQFNGDHRAVLCIKNNSTLELKSDWDDEYYATYEPIYVIEAKGTTTVTDIDIVLDIVHGVQEDTIPPGYVRLYRGTETGTFEKGSWAYITGAVTDNTSNIIGYTVSLTKGAGDAIAVFTEDLPNPYNGTVPPSISDRDRKDYVIGSIGGPTWFHVAGSPYSLPSSTSSGAWVQKTASELQEILNKASPTALETFQKNNIWKVVNSLGTVSYRIEPPYGFGTMMDLQNNILSLKGTLPGSVGTNPVAYCYNGGTTFSWTEIEATGAEYTGTGSVFVDNGADTISLLADDNVRDGFYTADGAGRLWTPVSGSLLLGDALSLNGDSTIPTLSGNFNYQINVASASATPTYSWNMKAEPREPLEEATVGNRKELRLKSTDGNFIPNDIGIYSYVAKRSTAGGAISFYWYPMAVITV